MEHGKHEVRLHEIDVLYGLGTLLAILGHSHPNDWSSFPGKWVEFIYLFHMPLFFLIAGFLLAESKSLMRQSYGKWLWEKAQRLLTPYVVLSLIAMIPKYALEHNGLSGLTPGYLLTAFLMPREGIWGHFWFLQALFWMYAVFGMLRKRMPENSKIGGAALLAVLLVLHFRKPEIAWLCVEDLCDFFVYFAAGYLLRRHFSAETKKMGSVRMRGLICFAALVTAVCGFCLLPRSDGRDFLLAALLLFSCWELGQLLKARRTAALDFIAENVFTFYIYSWPAQAVVERLCSHFRQPWTVTTPLMFAVGILLPTLLVWIYRKAAWMHCRAAELVLGVRKNA